MTPLDRAFWVLLSRLWPRWRDVLVIVKPDTVARWHRKGFRRYWRAISKPGPDARVLTKFHAGNFRARQWRRILTRASLGHWTPKDLRDTFASHLLTRGINPAYVARQLGHADWSVTARHYARWTGGDYYVEAERLGPGEVPADLLARFQAEPAATTCPTPVTDPVGNDLVVARPVRQEPIEKKSA